MPTTPVSTSHTSSWDTLKQVRPLAKATWNTRAAMTVLRLSRFNDLLSVTKSGSSDWDTRGKVVVSQTSTWGLQQLLQVRQATRWNTLVFVPTAAAEALWRVHKLVTAVETSTWNVPVYPVSTSHTAAWNTLSKTHALEDSTWTTIGRVPVNAYSEWRVDNGVTKSVSSTWNVGQPLQANMAQIATVGWVSTYPN